MNGTQTQQQGWRGVSGPLSGSAETWSNESTNLGKRNHILRCFLARKCLRGVNGDRKETGASKGRMRVVLAPSSRSLRSDVDKDRDFCAVVIGRILSSMGVVSLMKTF